MNNLSIKKIQEGLGNKEFTAKELTEKYLQNAREKNNDLNVYLEIFEKHALEQAQKVDELIAEGVNSGPMMGVPIAMKDNILIEGEIASAASKILKDHRAVYDAGVSKKLKKQNAIFLGRSNMDEFAMGASTENSAFGVTKNPHDLGRVAGGSSGGSAAAVAADMAVAALGSDTGGSIRQPAHFCGVVGLKPTYGAVSRSGLIAMASSLDQIGPVTKTVEDAEILFEAIRGKDPYDNSSVLAPSGVETKKPCIGIPKEYFQDGIDLEVKEAVNKVVLAYEKLGMNIKEISLPHTKYSLSAYYIINPAEVSSNLARFDGIRYSNLPGVDRENSTLKEIYHKTKTEGFGEESKRRVILGTFVLSSGYYDAYYKKALETREYIKDDFKDVFKEVDVILTPVAPTTAFKIGEKVDDPLSMYLSDIFTIPASLAGLPAISIPTKEELVLPINFQLIGKHWHESDILSLGKLYEEKTT